MNINDIALIHTEQAPMKSEYSTRPEFTNTHNKTMRDSIAEWHIYGGDTVVDLAVTYNTSKKKVMEYVADYKPRKVAGDYSNHEMTIKNLSNLCGNSEIARRLGIPVRAVYNCLI